MVNRWDGFPPILFCLSFSLDSLVELYWTELDHILRVHLWSFFADVIFISETTV